MNIRRKPAVTPGVRMDSREKVIVAHIVTKLDGVYRNAMGKPEYARSMDQVMKDIWGIKKFCKTLDKAKHNESVMIALMRRLDIGTMWSIVRTPEHYRSLSILVATDHEMIKVKKKYENLMDEVPSQRDSRKIRQLEKRYKKYFKLYKAAVKTFRNLYDIKSVSAGPEALLNSLESWIEENEYGGDFDIFDGASFGTDTFDTVESMDDYVRKVTGGRKKSRSNTRSEGPGAFGLFDNADSDDDYDTDGFGSTFDDGYDEDEEEEKSKDDKLLIVLSSMADNMQKLSDKIDGKNAATTTVMETPVTKVTVQPKTVDEKLDTLIKTSLDTNVGLNKLTNLLVDAFTQDEEDEDDGGEADYSPNSFGRPITRETITRTNPPAPTVDDLMDEAEASGEGYRPKPGTIIDVEVNDGDEPST